MDKLECLECHKFFADDTTLHRHLRVHKLSMAYYYQRHYPRFDKFDGSLIRFKNRDYYLSADFNSRASMAQWFKSVSRTEAQTYIKNWFLQRKERKGLIYTPTQVELRTLPMAGIKFLQDVLGCSYFTWAEQLGYKNRFDLLQFTEAFDVFHGSDRILVDTREQLPLTFSIKTRSEALPFADYKLSDDVQSRHGFIERKGVGDLYGTVTTGSERFQRELDRAQKACAYVVILVEGDFEAVTHYPETTCGRVNIPPEVIFHRVRSIIQKNEHVQFLFVKDRDHASRAIERIFCSKGQYKRIDLQYAYDTGQLV